MIYHYKTGNKKMLLILIVFLLFSCNKYQLTVTEKTHQSVNAFINENKPFKNNIELSLLNESYYSSLDNRCYKRYTVIYYNSKTESILELHNGLFYDLTMFPENTDYVIKYVAVLNAKYDLIAIKYILNNGDYCFNDYVIEPKQYNEFKKL